ncbi:MAG TPA: hypothetical protein DHW64_02965 [Chitinophagaceae bacterium]|jgi:hypothetical protein|nr:hypothetical protein [Chitinophagaceae bacterium]
MRTNNGKIGLLIFLLFLQLIINCGCQRHSGKKITDKELSVIESSCPKQMYPVNLYYLDGNCSFCLAKAKDFDDRNASNGVGSVIVFATSNPTMTKLYIQEIALRSCVMLDSSNTFVKSFTLNSRYEISAKGEVLSESADK